MNSQDKYLLNLFHSLENLMRRYSKEKHQNNNSLNQYRGQGRVLAILRLKPEITQKELNYLLGMSRQSLSELLNKLEAADYITREPSPDDGRIMIIKITEEGLAQSELIEQEDDAPIDIFSCYSEEEKTQLIANLEKLVASLKEKVPQDELYNHYPRYGERGPQDMEHDHHPCHGEKGPQDMRREGRPHHRENGPQDMRREDHPHHRERGPQDMEHDHHPHHRENGPQEAECEHRHHQRMPEDD